MKKTIVALVVMFMLTPMNFFPTPPGCKSFGEWILTGGACVTR